MTNDVRDIRNELLKGSKANQVNNDIVIDNLVKHKTNGKTLIARYYDSETHKYVCYTESGTFDNRYSEDELMFPDK